MSVIYYLCCVIIIIFVTNLTQKFKYTIFFSKEWSHFKNIQNLADFAPAEHKPLTFLYFIFIFILQCKFSKLYIK